jgi:hypothetical protein
MARNLSADLIAQLRKRVRALTRVLEKIAKPKSPSKRTSQQAVKAKSPKKHRGPPRRRVAKRSRAA